MKSEGPTLSINELSVGFGGLLALDHVSMSADHGQIVGVIGPNGAGKTTLFNVICGFVRADSGTITYNGGSLVHHQPHDLNKLGIARTLQGIGLCSGLTVLENVMLGAQARLRCDIGSAFLGSWRSSREERRVAASARELLHQFDIGGCAQQLPSTLPYAIQKRTALARALIAEPSLLLLDEPASGLSEDAMDELATLIRGLSPSNGHSSGRAPHGSGHVSLRPNRRAQLRAGDRRWHTGGDPVKRCCDRGVPRSRRQQSLNHVHGVGRCLKSKTSVSPMGR